MQLRWQYLLIPAGFMLIVSGCSPSVASLDARELELPLMRRAAMSAAAGDVEQAIRLYTKALDEDPRLARAHLDLAILLHDQGRDYLGAIYHYRRYLELRPQTEKKKLINDRIRLASQSFAATILPADRFAAEKVAALEKENEVLKNRVATLQEEVQRLRTSSREAALEKINEALNARIARLEQELAALRGQETKTQPQTMARDRTYRVQPGDTLSSIAARFYGDAGAWRRIYEANQATLGGSDRVKVGQVLLIP